MHTKVFGSFVSVELKITFNSLKINKSHSMFTITEVLDPGKISNVI